MPYPENLEFEHKKLDRMAKNLKRQLELEQIAKNKYCEHIDWKEIINMLSKDDQDEYYKLVKKGGF